MNKGDFNKYEGLRVWQKAHQLVLSVYEVTRKFPSDELFGLNSQVKRSVSSIAMNIVEGSERRSEKEFIHFLYIAKSSLAEAHYQIRLSKDLQYIKERRYEELENNFIEVRKMVNGLINHLQKSVDSRRHS